MAKSRRATALGHSLLVLAPVVTIWLIFRWRSQHVLGVDFTQEFWVAAHRLLHGGDPYVWSRRQIDFGVSFPYLAPTAVLFVPFALLPASTSVFVAIALSVLALIVTLRALEVRDWRLYLFVFLWWPVANVWQTGNVTLLLGLGLALVWRYRDRPLVAGLLSAAIISLKPFVWPVVLWLVFTRRIRATGWTFAWGLAINALAWGAVGYGRVGEYLHLSATVTAALKQTGYGLIALLTHSGAPVWAGVALMAAVTMGLLIGCLRAGRRRDDRLALLLCVLLMLAATPLLWNHYFALLIVPLAIYRPRLSLEWFAGLMWWLCPGIDVNAWQAAVGSAVTVLIAYCLICSPGFTRTVIRRPVLS